VIFRCIAAPDAQFAKTPNNKKDAEGTPGNPWEREVVSPETISSFNNLQDASGLGARHRSSVYMGAVSVEHTF